MIDVMAVVLAVWPVVLPFLVGVRLLLAAPPVTGWRSFNE